MEDPHKHCTQKPRLRAHTWIIGVMLTLFALGLSTGASVTGCTAAQAADNEKDIAVIQSQYEEILRRLDRIEQYVRPPSHNR